MINSYEDNFTDQHKLKKAKIKALIERDIDNMFTDRECERFVAFVLEYGHEGYLSMSDNDLDKLYFDIFETNEVGGV